MKNAQLEKRFRLYLNGEFFHGGYDSIEQARAEIPSIVAGFSKADIEKLGGMEWSVQDTQEQDTIILSSSPFRLTLKSTMSAHGPVMKGAFHGCTIEADPKGLWFTVIDEESRAEFYQFKNDDWTSSGENVTGDWDGNAFGEVFGTMLGLQK
jgi:hypothetical protein